MLGSKCTCFWISVFVRRGVRVFAFFETLYVQVVFMYTNMVGEEFPHWPYGHTYQVVGQHVLIIFTGQTSIVRAPALLFVSLQLPVIFV